MIEVIATLQANALLFGLLLVRISAMFATAPVLSSRVVPIRVRAGLAVILALATLPLVADGTLQVPESTVAYVLLAAKEVVVGIAIGLIAQMLFAAVQVAGSVIDMGSGFAMAQTIDPTSNANLSLLGRVYNLIATTVFIAIGGHLILVQAVVASFGLVPPTSLPNPFALSEGMLVRSADLFMIAMQVAAPLMAALLITDVALGIISRAAPQMNVFIVGLPVKAGVALMGTAVLLPAFVTLLNGATQQMFQDLSDVLRATGSP
ncbi:MAG: flagellar biosynthetic protein FliR [Actinobacteria bacterium]|nr:flagellar biosynthetic protein FliR [Actinomycetota bacterium]